MQSLHSASSLASPPTGWETSHVNSVSRWKRFDSRFHWQSPRRRSQAHAVYSTTLTILTNVTDLRPVNTSVNTVTAQPINATLIHSTQ